MKTGGFITGFAVLALVVTAMINLCTLPGNAWLLRDIQKYGDAAISQEPPAPAFVVLGCLALLEIPVSILTAIAFLVWFARAYGNLRHLKPQNLQWSVPWAVGGFFVPIMNIFMPFSVAREIWRNSQSRVINNQPVPRVPLLVLSWWLLFLASGVLDMMAGLIAESASTAENWRGVATLRLPADALSVAAATLTVVLIFKVDREQKLRWKGVQSQNGDA